VRPSIGEAIGRTAIFRQVNKDKLGAHHDALQVKLLTRDEDQSVCGGPSSSLSLAFNIAIRISASARVRFGLNASSS
jgi:hypothetical protein